MILHIGMSKTGSTSIQKVLSRQRAALQKQGLFYPDSPGHEAHGYLAFAATTDARQLNPPDKPIWQGQSPSARLARFQAEYAAEMSAMPAHVRRIIISDEKFTMMLLDRQSVQNLHDLLRPYADRIEVVVYLRRPDLHFVSLYTQLLRRGEARRPEALNLPAIAEREYDYGAMIERWASVFGQDAIRPRLFQREAGAHFDVVDDFLSICELDLAASVEDRAKSANQSINLAGQTLLQHLGERLLEGRKGAVKSPLWQRLTVAASEALPGRGWQMTRAQAKAFVAVTAERHDWIRRRWFADRTSLFSTDFSDLPEFAATVDAATLLDASLRLNLELAAGANQKESKLAEGIARLAEQAGDTGRQLRALTRRAEKDPANLATRIKLARLHLQLRDIAAARWHADAALHINAQNAEARLVDREVRESGLA